MYRNGKIIENIWKEMESQMGYFPLFVNLSQIPCLIIGGGNVATRKIKTLLGYGANCFIIAPSVSSELEEIVKQSCGSNSIYLIRENIEKKGVSYWIEKEKWGLVLCTTNNPKTNEEVAFCCHEKKIPVNVADNQELCSFFFPSTIYKQPISIGITTSGASPLLSSHLRKKIETLIDTSCVDMAKRMASERQKLKETIKDEKERKRRLKEQFEKWKLQMLQEKKENNSSEKSNE